MSLHVASLIVRARAELAPDVAGRIARMNGAEIHAIEDGKIIVVVEADSERGLADRMDEIRCEPDVMLVNLVYHHMDQREA